MPLTIGLHCLDTASNIYKVMPFAVFFLLHATLICPHSLLNLEDYATKRVGWGEAYLVAYLLCNYARA